MTRLENRTITDIRNSESIKVGSVINYLGRVVLVVGKEDYSELHLVDLKTFKIFSKVSSLDKLKESSAIFITSFVVDPLQVISA